MSLSRREFIRTVSRIAGATVPVTALAAACSGSDPGLGGTSSAKRALERRATLDATMLRRPGDRYQPLRWGAGEPFAVRDDLGVGAGDDRAERRRSVIYLCQMSDTHIVDAQSPGRIDWAQPLDFRTGPQRPQETLTVAVLAEMVRAVNRLETSVVTGAPLTAAVVTGDLTDSQSEIELSWFLDVLDGVAVVPNSGTPRRYDGVQTWEESTFAWHPDDPSRDMWGERGYPKVDGLLRAAVRTEVRSPGLRVPWFSVMGNHDSLFMGSLIDSALLLREFTVGDRKLSAPNEFGVAAVAALTAPADVAAAEAVASLYAQLPTAPNVRTVAPDPRRREVTAAEHIDAHFVDRGGPGPVGHGYPESARTTGEAWWTRQLGPVVRLLGLDTNNHHRGVNGCIVHPEWEWLEAELRRNSSRFFEEDGTETTQAVEDHLFIVVSHHTSTTMDNPFPDPAHPGPTRDGPALVQRLLRFPNVVLWLDGHTHQSEIRAHPAADGASGFWEVTTPSCIDWAQHSRMVELVDNRDGTLSVFTFQVDHAADLVPGTGELDVARMAAWSRELSANPWFGDPGARRGRHEDRNTELMLPAPFDLSRLSDRQLEISRVAAAARIARQDLLRPVWPEWS